MFKTFVKLLFLFRNWDLAVRYVEDKKREKWKLQQEQKQHHLNLCHTHQQEQNRSTYSENNCDYCKLLHGKIREVDKEFMRKNKSVNKV